MSRKIKKIVFKPIEKLGKHRVCVRLPEETKRQLKTRASEEYPGRSKQSRMVEDAIKYYIFSKKDINWQEYQRDNDYAELVDDIIEGLNQKNLSGANQIFLSDSILRDLAELEMRVRLTKPLMNDVRTGIIRKAISIRLSAGDKEWFDSIMRDADPLLDKSRGS